jgi:hypothetical protein
MARSLSVKIPTASLIADIEASLAKIEAEIATYPQDLAEYREAKAKHQELVLNAVVEALKNPENIGTDHDAIIRVEHNHYGRNSVSITVRTEALGLPEAPTSPTEPNQRQSFGRDYTTRKQLLEKNLKVLKMTSQEEVSATTYNTVIDLL